MVIRRYNKVTHKLTEDLAELIIATLRKGENQVYAVYAIPEETLIAELKPFDNQKMLRYGYKKLVDTSAITEFITSTPSLQGKTKLEGYLYKIIKREEVRVSRENKAE